jgi:cysteine sulfinate desulfinase/cysteine desulfurase-like protein
MHSVAACSLGKHMRARVSGVEALSHAVAMATAAQVSIHGLNQRSIRGLNQSWWWTSLAVMAIVRRVVPVCSSVASKEVQCC